ncbi:MAG: hypothetical protein JWN34_5007 [Bryobacterales bacterium]|nr:hypothetical protein [Bryobacterales bacterium]
MKKEQFERAKKSPDKGVLVHLVCNEADALFYSDEPEALSTQHCTVLTVETFFAAICDGGMAAWFDLDHGQLAHRCPEALRRVGLDEYAALAEETLRFHCKEALPTTVADWGQHLHRIRCRHCEEDPADVYASFDTAFFASLQRNPSEFRARLYDYIVEHESDFVSPAEG